ncbi:MAG: YceD family protein, partial [Deltaproteobacteria bacterium]
VMKIKIDDIPDDGLSVNISEDGKTIEKAAGYPPEARVEADFSIKSPVKARLSFYRSGELIDIEGDMDATVVMTCSMCVKDFEQRVAEHFTNRVIRGSETSKEKELFESDMEVEYFPGDELDTSEILLERIALDIPIKPVCSEDCKGFCALCGKDLNQGPCGCEKKERIDSRFAKLKEFKVK